MALREHSEGILIDMGIERMEEGRCRGALLCFETAERQIRGRRGQLGPRLVSDLAYCLAMRANLLMQIDGGTVEEVVAVGKEALGLYSRNQEVFMDEIMTLSHNLGVYLETKGREELASAYSHQARAMQEVHYGVSDARRKIVE